MALSNIHKEPARELIETVAGIALVLSVVALVYPLACVLHQVNIETNDKIPFVVDLIGAAAIMVIVVGTVWTVTPGNITT